MDNIVTRVTKNLIIKNWNKNQFVEDVWKTIIYKRIIQNKNWTPSDNPSTMACSKLIDVGLLDWKGFEMLS